MPKFHTDSRSTDTVERTIHLPIPLRRRRLLPQGISALLVFLATACSGSGSDPVIVSDGPNSGPRGDVVVDPTSFLISEGETLSLTARIGTTSIGASQVSWSVSPSSSATIDNYGVLTAVKHGDVTVTARYTSIQGTSNGTVRAIPHELEPVAATEQVGIVARPVGDSIGIRAVSRDGVPVPGVEISFELPDGDGILSQTTQETDHSGVARVVWKLGETAGLQLLRAHAANLGEVLIQAEALPDYDSAQVVGLAGDEQEGVVATFLPEPLLAQVTDQFGNILPGLAVQWSFYQGGGAEGVYGGPSTTGSMVAAVTDGEGLTEVRWKLGTAAGDQESLLEVTNGASGASGTSASTGGPQAPGGNGKKPWKAWKARGKPANPDGVEIIPGESWELVDEQKQLSAVLVDPFGNPVDGGDFDWRADNSGVVSVDASGKVRGLAVGRAAVFARNVSDDLEGSAWVNVQARMATEVQRHTGAGQLAPVGSPLPSPVGIRVLDQAGDPVPDIPVFWTIGSGAQAPGPNGPSGAASGGEPSSPVTYTDQNGVSQTEWTLGFQAGQQVMQALVDTLPVVEFVATASPGPMVSLSLAPAEVEIQTGLTQNFSAQGQDEFGNAILDATYVWTSSNPEVGESLGNGAVKGKTQGVTEVTANSNGVVGSATLSVIAGGPAAAGIAAGNGQGGVVGSTLPVPISLGVFDDTGAPVPGAQVSWTVATGGGSVSAPASVTGPDGVAEIGWTLGTVAGAQAVEAAVGELPAVSFGANALPGPVASVQVTPSAFVLQISSEGQMEASAKDSHGNAISGGEFSWSSQRTNVATVSGAGLVRGVSDGQTQIFASLDGIQGSGSVTVNADPTIEITLVSGDNQTGSVGGSLPQPIRVQVRDGFGLPMEGADVSWQVVTGEGSVAPEVSSTDGQGNAEAVWTLGTQPGTNTVSAFMPDAGAVSFTATGVAGQVAEILVSPSISGMEVGGTKQFSASVKDAQGNDLDQMSVVWSSSNASVASVNSTGMATASSLGVTEVRASAGGVTGKGTLTVLPSGGNTAGSLVVSPQTLEFSGLEETAPITVDAFDSLGAEITDAIITWTTSNSSIATVNQGGTVTSKAWGTAWIVATAACCSASDSSYVMVSQSVVTSPSITTQSPITTGKVGVAYSQPLAATGGNGLYDWSISGGSTLPDGLWLVENSGEIRGTPTVAGTSNFQVQVSSGGQTGTKDFSLTITPENQTISGDTIALQITRLAGGSGEVLVSTGIPLPMGLLRSGETNRLAVLVNGVEQSIYVEDPGSNHRDGSLRSVLIQFRATVNSTPLQGQLIVGPQVDRSTPDINKTPVTWIEPPAVALPTSAHYLVSTGIVGETVPVSETPGFPAFLQRYEDNFVSKGDQHWDRAGPGTTGSEIVNWNYYDRALIWYAGWARTGDIEYWRRGTQQSGAYQGWVLSHNGGINPRDDSLEGLDIRYLLTGDTEARRTIVLVADHNRRGYSHVLDGNSSWVEGRIQARVLLSHILAWRLGDTSQDWGGLSEGYLTTILGTQGPDGSYDAFPVWDHEHIPFMTGLLHDVYIKYQNWYKTDSRIPPAIKAALDFQWDNMWMPADNGFKYRESYTEGTTDLNLLIANDYAWYYQHSGNSSYLDKAEEIFSGGVYGAWLDGFKHFNENYRESYRYLFYRR